MHRLAAAVGHVHVEQHDVRVVRPITGDRLADAAGLADDLDPAVRARPARRSGTSVVVDQDTTRIVMSPLAVGHPAARPPCRRRGALGPSPRRRARSIRPTIDPRSPCRSSRHRSGSKPAPRSRTNTVTSSGSTSAYSEMVPTPACLAALTIASLAACTTAPSRSSTSASPTTTLSTCTTYASSTSPATASSAARELRPARRSLGAAVEPGPQLALLAAGQRGRPRAARRRAAGSARASAAPSRAGARPSRPAPGTGSAPAARRTELARQLIRPGPG